jgi:hypothetical protein
MSQPMAGFASSGTDICFVLRTLDKNSFPELLQWLTYASSFAWDVTNA